jgi:hypothetical protein
VRSQHLKAIILSDSLPKLFISWIKLLLRNTDHANNSPLNQITDFPGACKTTVILTLETSLIGMDSIV